MAARAAEVGPGLALEKDAPTSMKYHATKIFEYEGRKYNPGDIVNEEIPEQLVKAAGLVAIGKREEPKAHVRVKARRNPQAAAKHPKISVIVTFHDQKRFVDDCLGGFLEQTIEAPYEVIAIDDSSKDGTGEYIREKYPEVRYYRVDFARANASRNYGLEQARGHYICYFDGDDHPYPQYLEKLYAALRDNPKKNLAYARFDYEPLSIEHGYIPMCNHFEWEEGMIKYGPITNTPIMLTRALAEKARWDNEITVREDYEFGCSLIENGADGIHVPEKLWYYRHHPTSKVNARDYNWAKDEAMKYIAKKHHFKRGKAECTLVSMISRHDTLKEYFDCLARIRMPREKMHWFIFVDSNDPALRDEVRILADQLESTGQFMSRRKFYTNEQNLVPSSKFTARAMRIARNLRCAINDAARKEFETKYIFMVEDDTIVPDHAYETLMAHMGQRVAYASGAECAKCSDRHMGLGHLTANNEGEINLRILPNPEPSGTLSVNSGGWYCWIGKVEALKRVKFRCIEDGRYLGPDSLMVYDLDALGYKCVVDWSVACDHWDPIAKRFIPVAEGQGYEIKYEYRPREKRWATDMQKI